MRKGLYQLINCDDEIALEDNDNHNLGRSFKFQVL